MIDKNSSLGYIQILPLSAASENRDGSDGRTKSKSRFQPIFRDSFSARMRQLSIVHDDLVTIRNMMS